jgi:hypothetical protein
MTRSRTSALPPEPAEVVGRFHALGEQGRPQRLEFGDGRPALPAEKTVSERGRQ